MDSHLRPIHQSQALSRREFLRGAAGAGIAGAGVVLLAATERAASSTEVSIAIGPEKSELR